MAAINPETHRGATRNSRSDAFCEKKNYLFGLIFILFHGDRNKDYIHSASTYKK